MKDGIVVECQCKDWKTHSEDIFRAQVFYSLSTGQHWSGGVWKFCPWCGVKLKRVKNSVELTERLP